MMQDFTIQIAFTYLLRRRFSFEFGVLFDEALELNKKLVDYLKKLIV